VRKTIIEGRSGPQEATLLLAFPEDRMPIVTVPLSDPRRLMTELSAKLQTTVANWAPTIERKPIMGSEDFGIFSMDHKIPAVMAGADPAKVVESERTGASLPRRTRLSSRLCRSAQHRGRR
jgi:hippurate hydrolase